MKSVDVLYMRGRIKSGIKGLPLQNYFVYSEFNFLEASLNPYIYSVKLPINGSEEYLVDDRKFVIDSNSFLVTNPGEDTEAHIKSKQLVRGICIGLTETFITELAGSINNQPSSILEQYQSDKQGIRFLEHRYRIDQSTLSRFLNRLKYYWEGGIFNQVYQEEEFYFDLGELLIRQQMKVYTAMASLDRTKRATREELYRRIDIMDQMIHDCYLNELNIGELARRACLSKYHAIRTYQRIKGISPYQKILCLRLKEARRLILQGYKLSEIAIRTNFSDRRALSRAFKKRYGYLPSKLRI